MVDTNYSESNEFGDFERNFRDIANQIRSNMDNDFHDLYSDTNQRKELTEKLISIFVNQKTNSPENESQLIATTFSLLQEVFGDSPGYSSESRERFKSLSFERGVQLFGMLLSIRNNKIAVGQTTTVTLESVQGLLAKYQ